MLVDRVMKLGKPHKFKHGPDMHETLLVITGAVAGSMCTALIMLAMISWPEENLNGVGPGERRGRVFRTPAARQKIRGVILSRERRKILKLAANKYLACHLGKSGL
jgi:hypothetical protein